MSDSDVIYYNLLMTGNPNQATQAKYEETRNNPFIENPSDYYMSVVRFSIDSAIIPLFVCPIIENPGDPTDRNFTPFTVSFMYGGVAYTENVRYIPSSNTPTPMTLNNPNEKGYYFVYTYTDFIRMVNNAIDAAMLALTTAAGLVGVRNPYFAFDSVNQLISLVVPNQQNPLLPLVNLYETQFSVNNEPLQFGAQPAGMINMYLNGLLLKYFDGFESYFNIGQQALAHLNIIRFSIAKPLFPPQNALNTPLTQTLTSFTVTLPPPAIDLTYTAAPLWYEFIQQYQGIPRWSSFSSIVFLTSTIPVQYEFVPSQIDVSQTNIGNTSFRPIMADFVPDQRDVKAIRSKIIYYPQGPYRLIELKSNQPLRRIDLYIYWADNLNNLYPLFISSNETDSVKLMFIKKDLVKYNKMIAY